METLGLWKNLDQCAGRGQTERSNPTVASPEQQQVQGLFLLGSEINSLIPRNSHTLRLHVSEPSPHVRELKRTHLS
jgi:hypothetical protein